VACRRYNAARIAIAGPDDVAPLLSARKARRLLRSPSRTVCDLTSALPYARQLYRIADMFLPSSIAPGTARKPMLTIALSRDKPLLTPIAWPRPCYPSTFVIGHWLSQDLEGKVSRLPATEASTMRRDLFCLAITRNKI